MPQICLPKGKGEKLAGRIKLQAFIKITDVVSAPQFMQYKFCGIRVKKFFRSTLTASKRYPKKL